MYYKLGKTCVTNWGSFILLQIRANFATNWGSFAITICGSCCSKLDSYCKLGQPLSQNMAAITNWGKTYYKLGQVLQIRAVITNCGISSSKMEDG